MDSSVSIRNFCAGDEVQWSRLLREAYGNLESMSLKDIGQFVGSGRFVSEWLFSAKVGGEMIGSIWIRPLPHEGYHELWDLVVSLYEKLTV